MSFVRKVAAILKKAGYKKEHDDFGVSLYLKWVCERYACGVSIYKCPKDKHPNISVGLLDKALGVKLGAVEGSEDMGIYHLSVDKDLYSEDFFEQEQSKAFLGKAILMLEEQLTFFEQHKHELISEYKEYSFQLKWVPYFYGSEERLKMFGAIYLGLVYRLIENGNLSDADIDMAIKLADEVKANTRDFQFKLSLLKKYLDSNKLWN